jgi:hypothetical protein
VNSKIIIDMEKANMFINLELLKMVSGKKVNLLKEKI